MKRRRCERALQLSVGQLDPNIAGEAKAMLDPLRGIIKPPNAQAR